MKLSIGIPDSMAPGARKIAYGLFCWANRNIVFLRGVAVLLRLWPSLAGRLGLAVRASAVKGVLMRPESFSNSAHVANLVSGEYMIAMDPGPVHDADRALIEKRLTKVNVEADANAAAQAYIGKLKGREFDLLEDYLMWVAFHAIQPVFGAAGDQVAVGAGKDIADDGLQRQYLLEIRYVAGQLLAGGLSTLRVRRRAELCGDSLQSRIRGLDDDIRAAWQSSLSTKDLQRNAVGLAWISHPVTVQSGALVVQEMLSRPDVYRELKSMTEAVAKVGATGGAGVWTDPDFRNRVRDHVLELMRFRPIFPLLARNVPRDAKFATGGRKNAVCPGGGKVAIWSIAALFDRSVRRDIGKFCPHRDWGEQADLRWLMFGYGPRQCPAKDHAVEILTSALIGLLTLPNLSLARDDGKPIEYDGPLMSRMQMRIAPAAGEQS